MNKKELKNALPSIKERLSKGEKPEDIFDAVYKAQDNGFRMVRIGRTNKYII